MNPDRRRLLALRIVGLLFLLPFAGIAGLYLWIHRVADHRWAATVGRIEQLKAARPSPSPRPMSPASSPTAKEIEGQFVAAIRGASRRTIRRIDAWNLVTYEQGGEMVDVLVGDAQEFLGLLHQGARRAAASPSDFPPPWQGDWDVVTLTFMMNCCVIRARQLRETNAPFEAAQVFLDSLQFARFWGESGKSYNRACALDQLPPALDGLKGILCREAMSPSELRSLEDELEPLEAALRWPLRHLETDLAHWAENMEFCRLEAMGIMKDASFRSKFLLPERLLKAEAFEFMDRHAARVLSCEGKPYLELVEALRHADQETVVSTNPIIRHWSILKGNLGLVELERKAQIRLLRMAARYRATGEILDLEDPFGGRMLHSEAEAWTKFWSVGDDGRDDGGDSGSTGRWVIVRTVPIPGVLPPALRCPNDIVIDVERRR
jgi:hypothetical protein